MIPIYGGPEADPNAPPGLLIGLDTDYLHEPTREEIEAMFAPANFDTASNHVFDSWTDMDLYRAIDAPENPDGPLQDAEIAEYVAELKKRQAERERLTARSAELRAQHGIPE